MKALLLCLVLLGAPAWGAVVPDASVVEPDSGSPRLPPRDPAAQHSPRAGQLPPAPSPSGAPGSSVPGGPATGPDQPQVAVPTSGGAFSNTSNIDPSNTGETRPLEPLAPAPVSTASATPLWAALVLFLFLAGGGFWLAQRRAQE